MAALLESFADNPYFSAGFGLIGIGAGLAVLRQGSRRGVDLIRRQLLVSVEVPAHDKSHDWVLQWIASTQQRQMMHPPRHLSVETSIKQHDNGSMSTSMRLVPGQGKHLFKWGDAWIQVERQRDSRRINMNTGAPYETMILTTLSRDRAVFDEILESARQDALTRAEGRTVIYASYGPEWRPFGLPRKRRQIGSVILDGDVAQKLVDDVREFIGNGAWYAERGIPYRRGYLLYGVPGSGKSSFIQALAGELGYNICLLNLAERGLTDDRLNHLLSVAPERSLVLLEDIDAAFAKRDPNAREGFQSSVTFSGLLNALDGVASSEERMVFMTTNHIERLDPALIRPGRIDVRLFFGYATEDQIRRMFTRFYPEHAKDADAFVKAVSGHNISTAQLQGHFVMHKHDAIAAIEDVPQLVQDAAMAAAHQKQQQQQQQQQSQQQ
ncbi:hypothetical protein GQ42DRAFT_119516 [Ramicandelaber brevisporus]|nr:hypothetical protein GQ42DRAFT_119516 [Ramicandelaber brevisporus]